MSAARGPVVQRLPGAARFLAGLHQDADVVYRDAADFARSAASGAGGPAVAGQLRLAAALPAPDLRALWRRSGAEVVPVRVADMRRVLLAAAAALDGGR